MFVAIIAQQGVPTGDPIAFFISQGVLGVAVVLLWRDNRELRKQKDELYNRVMNDHIPLLTKATITIEKVTHVIRNTHGG